MGSSAARVSSQFIVASATSRTIFSSCDLAFRAFHNSLRVASAEGSWDSAGAWHQVHAEAMNSNAEIPKTPRLKEGKLFHLGKESRHFNNNANQMSAGIPEQQLLFAFRIH